MLIALGILEKKASASESVITSEGNEIVGIRRICKIEIANVFTMRVRCNFGRTEPEIGRRPAGNVAAS